VPDKGEPPPVVEYDPEAPTRIAEPEVYAPPLRPRVTAKPGKTVRDDTGMRLDEDEDRKLPETEALPPRNRFVTVEEEEQERELARRSERGPVVAQIILLAASLVGLIALAVYLMRPPSADKLYSRIEERAGDEDPDLLLDAADDVESFLQRFPDDDRTAQMKEYQKEIELLRLERRFAKRSRQLTRDSGLLPIERDYIEAMSQISVDPQRTADELRALVAVYSSGSGKDSSLPAKVGAGDDRIAQVLELARQQVARLDQMAREQAPAYLAIIDRGLHRASQMKQEAPEQARSIWRAIITLYGDKPWAAHRVQTARDELERAERKSE
jgi:hypothetical protein